MKEFLKDMLYVWFEFPEWVRVIGWITLTVFLTMALQALFNGQ